MISIKVSSKVKIKLCTCVLLIYRAFDYENRIFLLYELLKINISSQFLQLIRFLYQDMHTCLQINNCFTNSFPVETGTRPGCNLSPNLSNIFINDFPNFYNLIFQGMWSLQCRHNGCDGVSYHQPHDCLSNCLFRRRSKKTSKFRVTGHCAGNSPGTGELPAQMASYAENGSIWWRHHVLNTWGLRRLMYADDIDLLSDFFCDAKITILIGGIS